MKGLTYKVHRDAMDLIQQRATSLGYQLAVTVINAADYGVPQIRERCFVYGLLEGLPTFPRPTHGKVPDQSRFPWVGTGEVLKDLDTEENASDEGHYAGGRYNGLLKEVPPGDNYLYFTRERGHPEPKFEWRKRYWSFLLKLSPEMPSWTIQARRSNNMGPFHWRSRILRIPEIKRLQTFPDDYSFSGKIEDQWRQIGNAVPPLLANQLGEHIISQLRLLRERAA